MAIRGSIPAPVPSGPEGELLGKFNLRSRMKAEEVQNAKLYEEASSLCFFGRTVPDADCPLTDKEIVDVGKYFGCVSTSSFTTLKVGSDLVTFSSTVCPFEACSRVFQLIPGKCVFLHE